MSNNPSDKSSEQGIVRWSEDEAYLAREKSYLSRLIEYAYQRTRAHSKVELVATGMLGFIGGAWAGGGVTLQGVAFAIFGFFATISALFLIHLTIAPRAVDAAQRKELSAARLLQSRGNAVSADPDIRVEIQEVYPETNISGTGEHPYYIDEYFTVRVHLTNRGRPVAVWRYELHVDFERGVKHAETTPLDHWALERKQRQTPKWGYRYSTLETVQEALNDLSRHKAPIALGESLDGWLRFVLADLSPEQQRGITGITLWAVDAESKAHKASARKAQWRQSGELVNIYQQEQQRYIDELKKNDPNIECEFKEVHETQHSTGYGFDYIFTINVFLKNKGRAIGIKGYSLRMIQGSHEYSAERVSVKSYYIERQEPHPGMAHGAVEIKKIGHALTDLEDLKNFSLDLTGRDGWLRFVIRGVQWNDEYEADGSTRIPHNIELTVTDTDGVAHKFNSAPPWEVKGYIRKYADAR